MISGWRAVFWLLIPSAPSFLECGKEFLGLLNHFKPPSNLKQGMTNTLTHANPSKYFFCSTLGMKLCTSGQSFMPNQRKECLASIGSF